MDTAISQAVATLMQRYWRAKRRDREFDQGRAEGYLQAIALVTGNSHADTKAALDKMASEGVN